MTIDKTMNQCDENCDVAEFWDEASRAALTLDLPPKERGQEFRLPSSQGKGLGMRAIYPVIQQRQNC